MAGSLRNFKYTANSGLQFALNLDESNTLLVNGSLATADLNPTPDLLVLPVATRCRRIPYRSLDGQYSIVAVALTKEVLTSAPASITLQIAPSSPTDAATSVTLVRGVDRPERFPRAKTGDTGQTT